MRRHAGFTLLEVMIALLVTALALAALAGAAGRAASDTGHLRDRTEAAWVAQNVITDLRLAPEWPAPGTRRGEAPMLGRRWYWQVRITPVADPDLRRAEVVVARDADAADVLGRWVVHLGRP
jgi:general secretion pathway protein I